MTKFTKVLVAVFGAVLSLTSPVRTQDAYSGLASVTPTTGKLVFNFTITVATPLPKNAVIVCKGTASVSENSGQGINDNAQAIAGAVSNGKASCVATMPYSWLLATPGSDTVFLSYSVEMDEGLQVTATNGTSTVVVPVSLRKVNQAIGTIAVPLNGATTSKSVSTTI